MFLGRIKIVIIFLLLFPDFFGVFGQIDSTLTQKPNLLLSKDQIISGISYNLLPSTFLERQNRVGNSQAIHYQSQFLTFDVLLSEMAVRNKSGNLMDTFQLRELSIGGTVNIKKLSYGKRLFDLYGILFVPSVHASVGSLKVGEYSRYTGRLGAKASLQFPFFAVEARFSSFFQFGSTLEGVKRIAFIPEIGITADALYSLLDAKKVHIGDASGTTTMSGTYYSTKSKKEGDYIVTTTYRHDYTRVIPYSINRYATVIGPLAAIGPHVGFQNVGYSGPTRTYGIGYYLRGGIMSSDFLYDFGKIGFASKMEENPTISNPQPDPLGKVSKEDFSNPGYYQSHRFQMRLGLDLLELYYSTFDKSVVVKRGQGKFTRIIGGLGIGYAVLSSPKYLHSNGREYADSLFNADFTLLSTSANHAKFGNNGAYLTLYGSFEAGAIRISLESNRYFRANLANVKSISVAYMFPYNRIKKKLVALRALQDEY